MLALSVLLVAGCTATSIGLLTTITPTDTPSASQRAALATSAEASRASRSLLAEANGGAPDTPPEATPTPSPTPSPTPGLSPSLTPEQTGVASAAASSGGTQSLTPTAASTLTTGPTASAVPARFQFGSLATHADTAATEKQGGAALAMLEFNWGTDEPATGAWNSSYEQGMKAQYAKLAATGMKITLSLGMHFSPSWLGALPNARYIDEHGKVSSDVNFVFNQSVRSYAERYIRHLATLIPFNKLWAVRINSGGNAEMLYPSGGSYWAFDANALGGANLATGLAANPFPSWHPGDASLTSTQLNTWLNWYIGALANVAGWQAGILTSLGFTGYFQYLTPGVGTLPAGMALLMSKNLPGGQLGLGSVWDRFYAMLPVRTNAVAYVSSMADGSGGNDGCQSSDTSVALSSSATLTWSATRWIARVARANGMLLAGENPGYVGFLTPTYSDLSSTGMAAVTAKQGRTCGMQAVYWAHDDQIWNGTVSLTSLWNVLATG